MPSDEIIETMAEGLWQGEWARGGPGGKRRVPWGEISEVDQERYRSVARAALAAAEAAGWVMVPKEPTRDMLNAAYHAVEGDIGGDWIGKVVIQTDIGKRVLRAMLAAAGEPE